MASDGRVIAVIPARGGSKRTPRKNARDFRGRPLLAWSIDAARGSRYVGEIVVSTEDAEIAGIARGLGAEVIDRPAELASDTARSEDALRHVLGIKAGYDWIVLLQPTSPLRTSEDIDGCIELCKKRMEPACVSYRPDGTKNGAVYVALVGWLMDGRNFTDYHIRYNMPDERSLDIDYPEQFE